MSSEIFKESEAASDIADRSTAKVPPVVSQAVPQELAHHSAGPHTRSLSPGYGGIVVNPIIKAEFRRWRARPLTYLAIVAVALAGIWYTLSYRTELEQFITSQQGMGADKWGRFGVRMIDLIVRPSTIIPLLMVWRALVSFRPSGLYQPFRTTFLTPGEFLWGIVTIPFIVSLLVIMLYTGIRLLPEGSLMFYYSSSPEIRVERMIHPFWVAFGVLFEGASNGAVICLAALYFGLLFKARMEALVPIIGFLLLLQSGHAIYDINDDTKRAFTAWLMERMTGEGDLTQNMTFAHLSQYLITGLPKLALCFVFWALTTWHLRERDMP